MLVDSRFLISVLNHSYSFLKKYSSLFMLVAASKIKSLLHPCGGAGAAGLGFGFGWGFASGLGWGFKLCRTPKDEDKSSK